MKIRGVPAQCEAQGYISDMNIPARKCRLATRCKRTGCSGEGLGVSVDVDMSEANLTPKGFVEVALGAVPSVTNAAQERCNEAADSRN